MRGFSLDSSGNHSFPGAADPTQPSPVKPSAFKTLMRKDVTVMILGILIFMVLMALFFIGIRVEITKSFPDFQIRYISVSGLNLSHSDDDVRVVNWIIEVHSWNANGFSDIDFHDFKVSLVYKTVLIFKAKVLPFRQFPLTDTVAIATSETTLQTNNSVTGELISQIQTTTGINIDVILNVNFTVLPNMILHGHKKALVFHCNDVYNGRLATDPTQETIFPLLSGVRNKNRNSLRFDFVNSSRVQHLQSINSKSLHLNFFACNQINVTNVRLIAPEDSPNTDGIHIGSSSNLLIRNVTIATGDDCIAMVSGSKSITISEVSCGPGHGISIGSLGKSFEKESVEGINVWNSNLTNTQNGVRIKTWAPSLSSVASDITFSGIFMKNVNNPIFIDQNYCPFSCGALGTSLVQIRDVRFKDIWGTSSSKVAINLQCSKLVPCQNVTLENINLAYNGPRGPAVSSCSNVIGNSYGKQFPPGCL